MDIYNLIVTNKFLLEVIYAFVLSLICLVILFKTDRYFRLSLHSGLRYFRNAFLFYGLAFFWKFLFAEAIKLNDFQVPISQFFFEYLLVMGGLFLLYSLIWKKFHTKPKVSSLFNSKISFLHLFAATIAIIDCLIGKYFLLFSSQIIIFGLASIIAFKNYKTKNKKSSFSRFYFLALLMGTVAWVLNFLTAFLFGWNIILLIDVGILNIIFFLLVLFGILKIIKQNSTI